MNVNLIDYTKDPELMIARAGGISHKNEVSGTEEARVLVENFLDWGHYSPLEFASAMFYVEDVSRAFLAQITRHRHASFMVESQRYNKYDDFDFVIPDKMKDKYEEKFNFSPKLDHFLSEAQDVYDSLIDQGVAPEDARFFLPEGTSTSLYIKANFREWKHIIDLRSTEEAQWEIRKFAKKVDNILAEKSPTIFGDTIDS